MGKNRLIEIQEYLTQSSKDAWILVDYENKNKALVSFVGDMMLTRKIFMVFPQQGKPYIICHKIDAFFLSKEEIKENFAIYVYKTWGEMLSYEKKLFKDYKDVIMDISQSGLLPRIALADFGSVDFIRSLGIKISSSGDILQEFSAVYDEKAHQGQIEACLKTLMIKDEAFLRIKEDILEKGQSDEYEIQQFICRRFHEEGMVYDDPAIVAVNVNASNPHYAPTADNHTAIKRGDSVLIDMWAKMDRPDGVYADITWMGYVGEEVPEVYQKRFAILRKAVDSAFDFIQVNLPQRRVEGWEVDDVARKVVEDAGFGEYFTHRTGHNISVDVSPHGPGVNIDNYESHDTRRLTSYVSFSLEPGIYAPDFGMRSETDVFIDGKTPVMIAGRQEKVIPIMKL